MDVDRSPDELARDLGLPLREGPRVEPERSLWALTAPMNARRFAFLLAAPVAAYLAMSAALTIGCLSQPARAAIDVWRSAVAVVGGALWAYLLQARFRYLRCVESLCSDLVRLGQSAIRLGGTNHPGQSWNAQALRDAWNLHSDWSSIVMRYRFLGIDYPATEAERAERLLLATFKSLREGRTDMGPEDRLKLAGAICDVAEATSRGDTVSRSEVRG